MLLAGAIAISATLFAVRVRFLGRLATTAPPVDRSGHVGRRVRNEATIVLGQRKLLQRLVPGLVHAFIFWGFLVLLPTILIALIGVIDKHATLPWLGHQGWFAFLVDLFAVLVLVGVVSAVWIRKVQRPQRFKGSHLGEADLILAMIATIATSLLLWHACRIALGLNEWPASSAPVSDALSHLFADNGVTRVLERVFAWVHVLTILAFLAYLPHSKHLHIATAAINVWFGRTGRAAAGSNRCASMTRTCPRTRSASAPAPPPTSPSSRCSTPISCTECGRCQDACPAFATGKVLSPKLLIMGLRDQIFADGGSVLRARGVSDSGSDEDASAARRSSPAGARRGARGVGVGLRHLRRLRPGLPGVDRARRPHRRPAPAPGDGGVELPARRPSRCCGTSSARRTRGGSAQGERADWAAELGVRVLEPGDEAPEYLYWVGCASSFDERARRTAESTAKLLQSCGRRLRDPRPA